MRFKLTITIITSLTLFFCHSIFGQVDSSSAPSELFGTWYLAYHSHDSDTLSFTRTSHMSFNWGQRIEINKNGDFVDASSAKCGNDPSIHHTVGNWNYNNGTSIFKSSIVICGKDTIYKIATVTNDTLVFVKP